VAGVAIIIAIPGNIGACALLNQSNGFNAQILS